MWKFPELAYKRPDFGALKKTALSLIHDFEAAQSYDEQRGQYLRMQEQLMNLASMVTIGMIRADINTKDPFYAKERTYIDQTMPKLLPVQQKMLNALIHMKFRKEAEAEFGDILFKQAEAQIRLADKKLMPGMIRQSMLENQYRKITAGCSVEFHGEKCNFYGLLKYMQDPDREVRKAAFLEWSKLYAQIAPELDAIYDKLIRTRIGMAKKIGMDSYIPFAYLSRGRYDYGPDNVAAFRKAVIKYVVPACARQFEKQRERIGVDKLRYYDESYFYPDGNPMPIGNTDEMVGWAQEMYHELSPETGEFFDFMIEHELFDLETRDGKHMGGYCTQIPNKLAPFIFSNFNGTSADVDVLTHEAGHAFQAYLALRTIPIADLMQAPIEVCEIHSMTMEMFTYPWMNKFFGDNVEKYRYAHLSQALMTIPYLVAVDDFQHRVFENPKMTRDERYAAWRDIEKTYMPWRDYDGNEFLEKGGFWMQKQHIFLYPFYYVDYALAQTCAFDLYLKSLDNRESAWLDYLNLCRAGGTKGYFDLLKVASIRNPFDEDTIRSIVDAVEKLI